MASFQQRLSFYQGQICRMQDWWSIKVPSWAVDLCISCRGTMGLLAASQFEVLLSSFYCQVLDWTEVCGMCKIFEWCFTTYPCFKPLHHFITDLRLNVAQINSTYLWRLSVFRVLLQYQIERGKQLKYTPFLSKLYVFFNYPLKLYCM